MNTNYDHQHRDYLVIRKWATKYVSMRDHSMWSEYKIIPEHESEREVKATPFEFYELEAFGENPRAINLVRAFIEAFDVYDKYIYISNVKDWNSPTIECLLEQLTTEGEWSKIYNFPSAAHAWFHADVKFLVDGLRHNPNVLTYNYKRIARAHAALHRELLQRLS